jgi:predicted flap endonuclease-1-like 5' DNA nuclease
LRITRIALDLVSTTRLPVTFIAEAPGELSLTGWQVEYDMPDASSLPPVPPAGLCSPGRPEPVPGERPDECRYCPTCQGEHEMIDPQPMVTGGDLRGTRFTCANCGAAVPLPGVVTGKEPVRVVAGVRPAAGSVARRSLARVFGTSLTLPVPPSLDAVHGIGPATARLLANLGILSVADLAAAQPERLNALPRMTSAKAHAWIREAKRLLRTDDGVDPP